MEKPAVEMDDVKLSSWAVGDYSNRRNSAEASSCLISNVCDSTSVPQDIPQKTDQDDSFILDMTTKTHTANKCWNLAVRIGLCGVAVLLVWVTSLSVAEDIVASIIRTRTFTSLWEDEWLGLWNTVQQEEVASTVCTDDMVGDCLTVLNISTTTLIAQYETGSAVNKVNSDSRYQEANDFSTHFSNNIGAINGIMDLYSSVSTPLDLTVPTATASCPQDALDTVRSWMGVDASTSSAFFLSTGYVASTEALFVDVDSNVQERVDYDQSYLATKIGDLYNYNLDVQRLISLNALNLNVSLGTSLAGVSDAVATLAQCANLSATSECAEARQIYEDYQAALAATNAYIDDVSVYINDTTVLITSYVSGVDDTLAEVRANLAVLGDYYQDINMYLPNGFLDGFINMPRLSITFPGINLPPLEVPMIDVTATIPDLSHYTAAIDAQTQAVQDDATTAAASVAQVLNGTDLLPFFDDYNPPDLSFKVTTSANTNRENADAFLLAQADALNSVIELPDTVDLPSVNNITLPDITFSDFITNFDLHGETFGGSFDFDPVWRVLSFLSSGLVYADLAYRICTSLLIIQTYMTASAVNLPTIDIRKHKAGYTEKNSLKRTAAFVTSPVTICTILLIICGAAVIAVMSVYVPLYKSYVAGCGSDGNGTVFTYNLYAVTYNYAAQSSNEAQVEQLDSYDGVRMDTCSDYGTKSVDDLSAASNKMDSAMRLTDASADNLRMLLSCVDELAVSQALADHGDVYANLGLGYAWPWDTAQLATSNSIIALHSTSLSSEAYQARYGLLQDEALFNCSHLPVCDMTRCPGPDKYALKAASQRTGCASEGFFHQSFFRTIITYAIYLCVNVSRFALMDGLGRLFWRALVSSHGFDFTANCSPSGKFESEGFSLLQTETSETIKKFERTAYVLLAVALLAHAPYIALFAIYGKGI